MKPSIADMIAAKRCGMNERALAREIGISPTTLLRIKSGHVPDQKTLRKICDWLGVEVMLDLPAYQTTTAKVHGALAELILKANKAFNESINSVGHE